MLTNRNLVIVLSAVLAVLFIAVAIWPLNEQRKAAVDRAIEQDFLVISTTVNEYVNENGRLPNDLNDLDLDEDIITRGRKHSYEFDKASSREYQLCAVFKTDTTDVDNQRDSFDLLYTTTFPEQPNTHTAGRDCITYQTGGGFFQNGFEDFNIDGLEDLFESDSSSSSEPEFFEL